MKLMINDNGFPDHAAMLLERVAERVPLEQTSGGMTVTLSVDAGIGKPESYRILGAGENWTVTGADVLGLYFGIGKLLHGAHWTQEGFAPRETGGVISPRGEIRTLYVANHFSNFYENAPFDVLTRYIDDCMLWGFNCVSSIVPVITCNMGDEDFYKHVEKVKRIYRHAKSRGMKVSGGPPVNQGFKDAPHEADAVPPRNLWFESAGRNICMSKPEGIAYMKKVWKMYLDAFADIEIDYFGFFPYDEGGCGCDDCYPWGANKYLDSAILMRDEILKYNPNAKFVLATWCFDCVEDIGEYRGLYKRLTGDMSWIDYLEVDDHNDFPRYPLEHPLIKPIINFPEISMYGLYPWGGFGANPLPKRFQRIWDSSRHVVSGGVPYTEGIYEDISKVQWLGYYWNPDRSWQESLTEYCDYEFDPGVSEEVLEMISLIEDNHVRIAERKEPDMEAAERSRQLADSVNSRLSERAKTSWRWRILYIRAQLDEMRYAAYMEHTGRTAEDLKRMYDFSGDLLIENEQAQDYFRELQGYYHCSPSNGYNMWTLPPLGGTVPTTNALYFTDTEASEWNA